MLIFIGILPISLLGATLLEAVSEGLSDQDDGKGKRYGGIQKSRAEGQKKDRDEGEPGLAARFADRDSGQAECRAAGWSHGASQKHLPWRHTD